MGPGTYSASDLGVPILPTAFPGCGPVIQPSVFILQGLLIQAQPAFPCHMSGMFPVLPFDGRVQGGPKEDGWNGRAAWLSLVTSTCDPVQSPAVPGGRYQYPPSQTNEQWKTPRLGTCPRSPPHQEVASLSLHQAVHGEGK